MNIPIAGTLPSHEINSFSNSTVFRPDLYIPTQCQVIRSSATWSAGIGEVDGKGMIWDFKGCRPLPVRNHLDSIKDSP